MTHGSDRRAEPEALRRGSSRTVRSSSRPEDVRFDVLGMLGHDVGAPLTAIMACAESAIMELDSAQGDVDIPAVRAWLDAILRRGRELDDIRVDLLATAAADADAIEALPSRVGLLAALRSAVELAPQAALCTVTCPADLYVVVQPTHLAQIMSNLLSNACRYASLSVDITASSDDEHAYIAVRDDGPGVPSYVTARLFQRFAHVGHGQRPAGAGTGLGLYIVRVLSEANLGYAVHKVTDLGAEFVVTLPRVD